MFCSTLAMLNMALDKYIKQAITHLWTSISGFDCTNWSHTDKQMNVENNIQLYWSYQVGSGWVFFVVFLLFFLKLILEGPSCTSILLKASILVYCLILLYLLTIIAITAVCGLRLWWHSSLLETLKMHLNLIPNGKIEVLRAVHFTYISIADVQLELRMYLNVFSSIQGRRKQEQWSLLENYPSCCRALSHFFLFINLVPHEITVFLNTCQAFWLYEISFFSNRRNYQGRVILIPN